MRDRIVLTSNILQITIVLVEEVQIRGIRAEIAKWDDFLIPLEDPQVPEAAAMKYAATCVLL